MSSPWEEMNAVDEAFNRIATIEWLSERLQEAVDRDDRLEIINISHALLATIPTYISNFEEKFKAAWQVTVTPT